jgi:hypothetical protein
MDGTLPYQKRPVIKWRCRILQSKLPHRSKADTLDGKTSADISPKRGFTCLVCAGDDANTSVCRHLEIVTMRREVGSVTMKDCGCDGKYVMV